VSDYQPRAQGGWPAQPPAGGYGPDHDAGYGPEYGPGYGPTARPPRRRRRRRPLVALTVVIVVILVILGIGDQVAKAYAQNRIATQIEHSGLNAKPSVTIEGWPFLTQILSRDLKTVDISANNVTADSGKLPFSFTAKATGVHLNSSYSGATVDHITGQATLPFSSAASLFPIAGVTLSADPADGPDAVKADAGIAGSVTGTVKQTSPSKITITLNRASGIAAVFSQLSSNAVVITIPQLPAGLVVKSVSVTSQGIVATASASNTTLTE
jgi:LmeA-like phospholipid-binding